MGRCGRHAHWTVSRCRAAVSTRRVLGLLTTPSRAAGRPTQVPAGRHSRQGRIVCTTCMRSHPTARGSSHAQITPALQTSCYSRRLPSFMARKSALRGVLLRRAHISVPRRTTRMMRSYQQDMTSERVLGSFAATRLHWTERVALPPDHLVLDEIVCVQSLLSHDSRVLRVAPAARAARGFY